MSGQPGGASRWWLHHSLVALAASLADQGIRPDPALRRNSRGPAPTSRQKWAPSAVYCSRQYQPWSEALEKSVLDRLSTIGATLKRYPGTLLFEPEDVATGGGTPFKVFTPFWRACNRRPEPHYPLPAPTLTAPRQNTPLRGYYRLATHALCAQLGLRMERPVAAGPIGCPGAARALFE